MVNYLTLNCSDKRVSDIFSPYIFLQNYATWNTIYLKSHDLLSKAMLKYTRVE